MLCGGNDLKYVEALIGPETVDTVPLDTLAAYRDHGEPAPRLAIGAADASRTLQRLSELGIDLDGTTQQLEDEGVKKFAQAFDVLMKTLKEKQAQTLSLPGKQGAGR